MGGKSSREGSWRTNSSLRSNSSSRGGSYPGYSQSIFDQESYSYNHAPQQYRRQESYSYNYAPQQSFESPQQYSSAQNSNNVRRQLDRKYSRIADDYKSLDQVTDALARAGLESSNLIVGIDFTKSNEWTGAKSFNRRSLHHIGDGLNPYEQAISIIGKTLAAFDEDNLIPCFGFGDDERFCNGFEEVLSRYREIVPNLRLAGPTSFAPVIEMASTIVEQSGGQYHVLLIIADGQVTRSVDTERGKLSPQEQRTVDAIVEASKLPLSIVLVGVGDGPWDTVKEFDDNIPAREFDNFQFVNFTEIMSKHVDSSRKETEFALAALMEIPSQYKATIELNVLGRQEGNVPERVPLPPPLYGAASISNSKPSRTSGSKPSVPSYPVDSPPASSAPPAPSSTYDNQVCPICLTNAKDMAFGCGHQTCCECGESLELCPICRRAIQMRIKLY
ncbi:hypothetical protein MANES_17G110400v8 [Manihot esculenta]|uniref:Uncharacterized protein n=2 Tax=Manihot esculenta TaxID=3983 RepID=A0ACB7G896_MANES|nr:hypothetical protein MANES_17G110400v8 [Manihot esculenta]KAG8634947.1 hypothetical protein MANES_17G110400v8 [Manihot esculenta]